MKNTSPDLSKTLPPEVSRILEDVTRAASKLGLSIFLIGATARDIILHEIYGIAVPRATDDLDFGVAVDSWASYDNLKKRLIAGNGFEQDKKQEQRLWRGGLKIDIVPFGGLESAKGEIAFPPDGNFKMSTAGFPEAFDHAISVSLNRTEIRVASPAGIVLLKFIAYHDRPAERAKDLADIFFIARNYLDAGAAERLYDQEVDLLNDDFDYTKTGARILGRDLGKIMSVASLEIVRNVLSRLDAAYDTNEPSGVLINELRVGISNRHG